MGCRSSKVQGGDAAATAAGGSSGVTPGGGRKVVPVAGAAGRKTVDATTVNQAASGADSGAAGLAVSTAPPPTAIRVHTPIPHSVNDFPEFGEHNVYKCLAYLESIADGEAMPLPSGAGA